MSAGEIAFLTDKVKAMINEREAGNLDAEAGDLRCVYRDTAVIAYIEVQAPQRYTVTCALQSEYDSWPTG
jgi:hypothetical protein